MHIVVKTRGAMEASLVAGQGPGCWRPRKTLAVLVEKLYNVLARRYGFSASGATDVININSTEW